MKKTLAATGAAALLAVELFSGASATADTGGLPAAIHPATAAQVAGFSDVGSKHTYYAPVTWMVGEGITHGYVDGTFKPKRPITRGETASFLYRYIGPEHTAPEVSPFADLATSSSHYQAITWMHAEEMATGYTDGTFRQGQSITRGEAAILLYGMDEDHEKPEGANPFNDMGQSLSSYDAVHWLQGEGLAQGYVDHSSDPTSRSRAENYPS